jgi:hypothetical protein
MNARERRTIRIGVIIGTLVGLMGCSEQASNLQGAGHSATVGSGVDPTLDSSRSLIVASPAYDMAAYARAAGTETSWPSGNTRAVSCLP